MRKLFALVVAMAALAQPVWADTVTVGSLDIDWRGSGQLNISCDNGFQFAGSVGALDGVFRAWQLDPQTSAPGMDIDMSGYWTGLAVNGIATTNGLTLPVGSLDTNDWGDVRFSASVTAPMDGNEVSIQAPFEFSGLFNLRDQPTPITGTGTVTVTLAMFPGDLATPKYWDFKSATYAFQAAQVAPTPTPEPGTIFLGATGLMLAWLRKRHA